MKSVFNIFQTLKEEPRKKSSGFHIASLPSIKNHKIGISEGGLPMFFIKCDDVSSIKTLDYNLEYISVQFNKKCQLLLNKKEIEKNIFTVISLKTDSVDLQEYFLDVVFLMVKKLSPNPKLKTLKVEVEKLINLFSKFSKPALKTIQGLWAELLVIEQAKNPDYLVKAWHSSATGKFDFNDGVDKIEVKSTAKSRRVHNFSIEQLNPNRNSNLIVASVFAVETGLGKNIFDLIETIEQKLKDDTLVNRLNEIIIQTLGQDFEKSFEMFFDYQLAADTLAFYESEAVPKIEFTNIPLELSNIRFDSDLTDVKPIKKIITKSSLHKSLF
jgi:hypothetical protein